MTRIFRFDPKARLQEVERGAQALRERPEVLAVVLFGSLAQGQATAMSDADLFLLLSESSYPFGERLVRYRPPGLRRVEVFPYTLEEAWRSLEEGWGMARAALEGRLLWEREGAWTSFLRAAREAGVEGRYRKTWGVRRGLSS